MSVDTAVGTAAPADAVPNVATALERLESHLHPTPSWNLDDHPQPTGREEIWRFTPIKRFAALLGDPADLGTLDWQADLPEGVTVTDLDDEQAKGLAVEAPVDRVAAQAALHTVHRTHIQVPAEAELDRPVVFTANGQGGQARDHYVLSVGAHAKATVVIRFTGTASYGEKFDVLVGDGAQLNLVTVQDWAEGAVHGGQRSIRVGRDAQVKAITASIGGDIRLQEDARFDGPGGSLEQFGLYLVDAGQHIEHRLFVDHNAPHTSSNVDYRGALQGKGAHSVWIGDVLIRKVAEGIETYEANKNLVLTDGCQADSVPNLEIETGEIAGAGHSSTTGRFDDEQLFYLRSRGVPESEARRLVVHGFFNDIIRRIGVTDVEDHLRAIVEHELEILGAQQ
ncbi:SufB/SufD family protein [Aestuariimicrobium ganziense]|uniref:SufB/SufD family protein n=1 Tax=Aestuariimicrobium ganziense TaxID=2773677 RepID=UPI001940473E|nr:SufD family Fe-S cluster assembly protein [Aestuariimicrobium ganziense]